ncbi:unnamed protein product [Ectocarpus sp. 6 AP-2014]
MVFLRPLEKWAAEGMNGLDVPAGGVSEIFSNVAAILEFNERFLSGLAGRDGEVVDGRRRGIGTTLRRQSLDMFKPYSVYVKNYPQSLKTLAACEEFSEFNAFIRGCEHQDACHGLDLKAYLIQPVQRVPRYRLLIIQLLKHTRESHPDWADLNAALETVSSTVTKLNEGARDKERFVRALELQYEFREDFLKPSSHLVKEGFLLKVCNGGPRRYKFVLFSHMLVYGTEASLRAKLQRDHRKYKVHGRIPLHECLVLDYGSSDSFAIARSSGKSFVAMAVSAEEKQASEAWLDAFEESFAGIKDNAQQDDGNQGQRSLPQPQPQQPQQQQQPTRRGSKNRGAPSSPTSEANSSRRASEDDWTLALPPATRQEDDGRVGVGNANDSAGHFAEGGMIGRDGEECPPPLSPPARPTKLHLGFPSGGATLAQTVAASMAMPGRWSLPNGGGGGGGGGGRMSLASHATSGGGSSPRSARSSFTRRAGVQVWVPVHGRTEMHEISLRGLPAGSTSGLFKVQEGGASNDDLNNNDDDKNASGDAKGDGDLPPNGPKRKPLATTFPGARSASARLAASTSRQTTRSPSPRRHYEGDWVGGTVIAACGGGGAARGTYGGSGGNAAEGVDWRVGGGSEVGADGSADVDGGRDGGGLAWGRHDSTGLADRAETEGRGRPRRRLPAMPSAHAVAEIQMLPFSDERGDSSDSGSNDDDPASAVAASWRLTGDRDKFRKMLAKFEAGPRATPAEEEKGNADEETQAAAAAGGRRKQAVEPDLGWGDSVETSRGEQQTATKRQWQEEGGRENGENEDDAEEDNERFAYISSSVSTSSSSLETEHVNPLALMRDPVYIRPSERLNDPTTPRAFSAATAPSRDATVANATGAEGAPPGKKEYPSFPGTRGEEPTRSSNSRRSSRFLPRARSWTAKKRRSPQRASNSDNDDGESNTGGSRSNSPRRASAGMLGALQRSFRDRLKTNRLTSSPPRTTTRKRWPKSDEAEKKGLAGLFLARARGTAAAAAAAAAGGRKNGGCPPDSQQATPVSDPE